MKDPVFLSSPIYPPFISSKSSLSTNRDDHFEPSHYDKTDLNPFFNRTLSKPIPQWFLAVEIAVTNIFHSI